MTLKSRSHVALVGFLMVVTLAWLPSRTEAIPLTSPDYSLARYPTRVAPAEQSSSETIEIHTEHLTIQVQRHPWQLKLLDANQNPLIQELSELPSPDAPSGRYGTVGYEVANRWYHATEVQNGAMGADGLSLDLTAATNDPTGRTIHVAIQLASADLVHVATTISDPTGVSRVGVALSTDSGEHFFGLGEHFDSVDRRGQTETIWANDRAFKDQPGTYKPIPFFVSNRGYGLVVQSYARTIFELASVRPDASAIQVDGNAVEYTLMYGPTPLAVISRFADVSGHWPLPPWWAFGVWRNSIGGQEHVLAEARRLRELTIPVNALFVYDASDDDLNLGWPSPIYGPIHPGTYPDIPAMNSALHALGYRVLGYFRADVPPDRRSFRPLAQNGFFIRRNDGSAYLNRVGAAMLDFTNAEAKKWWTRVVQYLLTNEGFDGWMQDFGEGSPIDGQYQSGLSGAIEHNRYPFLYDQATYEAAMSVKPDFVSLARSATLGSQRYLRLAWPGDQTVDWSPSTGLPTQIPAMLSGAMSLIPDYAPDVGGFNDPPGGALSPSDEKELWIRWVQLGALSPTFRDLLGQRAHGAINLWTDPDTIRIYRDFTRLHLSLLPYIYSYARLAADTGQPILRHPFLEFPSDPNTYSLDRQFFLGDSLLVCPVVSAGARTQRCYVPEGGWIDYWTGESYRGPTWVTLAAPVDRIPILVRAGAIVPTENPDAPSLLLGPEQNDLTIRVFPHPEYLNQQSSLSLYDGTLLSYQAEPGKLSLTARGVSTVRHVEVRLPVSRKPTLVTIGSGEASIAYAYDPGSQIVSIPIVLAADTTVTVRW